jgi:hypothetical protein
VLQHIDAWLKSDAEQHMVEMLLARDAERYVNVWEYFADRIPGNHLLRLGDDLFFGVLERNVVASRGDVRPLGAFWRRFKRQSSLGQDEIGDWLADQIMRALETSLGFANDLYRQWMLPHDGVLQPIAGKLERVERARSKAIAAARLLYVDAGHLRDVLDDQRPRAVREFMDPPPYDGDEGTKLFDPQDWTWLAATLLNLVGMNTPLLTRVVAHVVGDFSAYELDGEGHQVPVYEQYFIDRPRTESLFGSRVDDVLRHLARSDDQALGMQARAWLDERRGSFSGG